MVSGLHNKRPWRETLYVDNQCPLGCFGRIEQRSKRNRRGLYADFAADKASSMRLSDFTDWTALRITDKDGVLLDDLPPIQRFLNRVLALPIEMQNALFSEFMERIAIQTERARAAGRLDEGLETLKGDTIVEISREDLWACPKTKAVTRIVGLDVTNSITVPTADDAIVWSGQGRSFMINKASGKVALISKRPVQVYDDDAITLMRRVTRPRGDTMITELEFDKSGWEDTHEAAFIREWNDEADALPKIETNRIYLMTGLLLPIWTQIPSQNERIYRVTAEGGTAMIGRSLSEDQAAVVRARFMTDTPEIPQDILTKITGSSAPLPIGQGLNMSRRRVAGDIRLEIEGADKAMIAHLKSMGCFTEIIAFQLRIFLPVGDGIDSEAILNRIMGGTEPKGEKAA